jgi:choline dehydrogenase-like flavoprotein
MRHIRPVLGVEGLRVVDTSVVPSVPRSNTNMLAVALAERIAERMAGASQEAR